MTPHERLAINEAHAGAISTALDALAQLRVQAPELNERAFRLVRDLIGELQHERSSFTLAAESLRVCLTLDKDRS